MGQMLNTNDAAVKDAQIKFTKEECALDMGQKLNTNDAAVKDALIQLGREEYVSNMEQHGQRKNAELKDAQIDPNEEDCVGGTVHTAIQLMNLQLSHHVLDPNLRRLL